MSQIDPRQYSFLSKLMHDMVKIDSLDDSEKDDCDYLIECGYVEEVKELILCDTFHGTRKLPRTVAYKITPAGRAARYEFKAKFYKWWIPVLISIAAILVSIGTAVHPPKKSTPQQIYNLEDSETLNEVQDVFQDYPF